MSWIQDNGDRHWLLILKTACETRGGLVERVVIQIGYKDMRWIELPQDRFKRKYFVKCWCRP